MAVSDLAWSDCRLLSTSSLVVLYRTLSPLNCRPNSSLPVGAGLDDRNEVADALSRPSIVHLQLSPGIDLAEMAAEQRRVGSRCDEDVSGLQLQELPLTTGDGTILCDVLTIFHRPFVPPFLRRNVFSSLHNLSHPGSRTTDKLVSDRIVWPGMHMDLKAWTCASVGCHPGCAGILTRAHHPSANGTVKRLHHQLKVSLRAADYPENWTDHLHLVLLYIRSSLKSDFDCSTAELVFGAIVRLPGEMISPTPRVADEDPANLLRRLKQFMRTPST
ncbi:hypothetical protein SprV_0401711200 [Sparganum proliferum]